MPLIGPGTRTPALYVLAGAGSVAMTNLAAAQAATGVTFRCLEVFNTNVPDWATWESPWFANDPSQGYTAWVAADPSNRQLIVSYNMIPTSAGSMSAPLTWETTGSTGGFNTHATALATNLVAAGLGSSIIRLGLECNGNWNIDSIGGSTPGGGTLAMRTAWAQTFAQEVTAMRAVAGANFTFCWCPNAVVAGVPFADYYPGNAYVDIIGIDAYDAFANGSQPAASAATTASLFAQSYGLNDITAFAVTQGKPLGLGEWGTQLGGTGGGLGDDPYYIQGIAAWVAANNVAFHCYFDSATDNIIPLSSAYPLTLNAYSAAFAAGGAPAVTTGAATGVSSSAATLNGTVNPKGSSTTWQFEYGTTTSYGTAVPGTPASAGSGSTAVAESYGLSGLTAATTYHYRLNATSTSGTTHGPDQQFTTTAAGGTAFAVSASVDNFNNGGALKVFAVTGVTEAGGASGTLQAYDPGGGATVSVTPAASGSLILFGAFERNTTALAAAASNALSDSGALAGLYYYADGRYTGTVTGGTPVTAGCSTVVNDWNDVAAYELQANGTPAIDSSTPSAATGTTSPLGTAAFAPPARSVLCAVVMASTTGTAASNITISDTSGLSLTWTRRAIVTQTGSYAGVAAIFTATMPGGGAHAGAAALSGSGALGGAGVFTGAAALSGSGTLGGAGARIAGHAHGAAALSGSGTLGGAGTGIFAQAAVLWGTGTLAGAWIGLRQQPPGILYGAGTLQLSGVILRYPAVLSGNGTLSILQATGGLVFASPGTATPQAYPLSSQVAVAPPGTTAWAYLGSLGHVTALTYSFTCPGGADKLSATVIVPAAYRTQLFNPGWQVRVTRGGHICWTGRLDEPIPTAQGWTLTAVGDGNRGQDFLAIYSSTWPSGQPDQSINNAVSRGLPWVNPGVGTPAGAWYGQAVDSGAQTVTALLNLICTRGALAWYVNSQPGGQPGADLTVFPLPVIPNRLLVSVTPAARTLGGDINTIYLRYQASGDTTSGTTSVPATFGTAVAQNAASVAAHGEIETYIDISDVGTMTAAAAQAVGTSVLQIYQRASFAGPFTARYGQLCTTGGTPVDPGTDQAGTCVRLILTDWAAGGEVTPQFPVTFITGAYEWDDMTQTAAITPYQTVNESLTGLLSLAHTELTPVTVASGP